LKDFDDIIILDGNSTDRTLEISRAYGARIFPQKNTIEKNVRIEDFSAVRNLGVKQARHEWFTFVDSDEYLSLEAVEEIRNIISKQGSVLGDSKEECRAFRRPRKYLLQNEIIDRATTYPNYQLRLFYLPSTIGFAKKVHEIMKLKPGTKVCNLQSPEYVPLPSIEVTKRKSRRYLDIQQESLKNLTFNRLVRGIRSNSLKTVKYFLKYIWISVSQKGKIMPLSYELHNMFYHVRLMCRMIENYVLKFVRN